MSFIRSLADIIDVVDYTKDEDFATIKLLAVKEIIDTVYVYFVDELHDQGYDCRKPSNMKELNTLFLVTILGWSVGVFIIINGGKKYSRCEVNYERR